MELKITKKQCLDYWDNSTCSGAYYLIHGRIIDDAGTGYYRFKFVLFFDFAVDLYDAEMGRDIELKDAIDDAICAFIPDDVDLFNNAAARAAFYKDCNRTIENYNRRNSRVYAY